jgi:ketosteroid isomerase-like protein
MSMDNMTYTEQEIIQLAHERSNALVHKDAVTLDRLLADTFRYTNASGIMVTKAEYFQHYVEPPDVVWTAQVLDETEVVLYPQMAVLTCRVHDQGRYGDQPFDAHYRSTFVWVHQQGRWQCVAGHTTAIA